MLSTRRLRWLVIGSWVALVAAFAATLAALDIPLGGNTGVMLLAAAAIPAVVMVRIWRDVPPQTIVQVLHPLDAPAGANRSGRATGDGGHA